MQKAQILVSVAQNNPLSFFSPFFSAVLNFFSPLGFSLEEAKAHFKLGAF